MNLPFRTHHLIQILEAYDPNRGPLDVYMHRYFRSHRSLGAADRREISKKVYGIVRWKVLLDFLCPEGEWIERLQCYLDPQFLKHTQDPDISPWVRCSCPKELFQLLLRSHGEKEAEALCLINNEEAPVTIRANTLKTSREQLLEQLSTDFAVETCTQSPWGIRFKGRAALFSLPAFQQGLFEMQDEGSQLLGACVEAQPGQQVLDYCAGAGGKSLVFAPAMQGKGQLYLHDIRKDALDAARQRLRRAGVQHAQYLPAGSKGLKKLKKRMDWVLVDAPCSGTGTLRRNPDMKGRINEDFVRQLVGEQRRIFESALSYLKKEGRIVYATCSILREENEEQVEHFLRCYPLKLIGDPFNSLPSSGGMDGFFAATFAFIE